MKNIFVKYKTVNGDVCFLQTILKNTEKKIDNLSYT